MIGCLISVSLQELWVSKKKLLLVKWVFLDEFLVSSYGIRMDDIRNIEQNQYQINLGSYYRLKSNRENTCLNRGFIILVRIIKLEFYH